MRTERAAVAMVLALALGACGESEPLAPPIREVGAHRVGFRVPEGWRHADHGREQRFDRDLPMGLAQLSMEDLGPVTVDGFLRELAVSRELFGQGRVADAREQLKRLDLRPWFSSAAAWQDFVEPWTDLTRGRARGLSAAEVESAYDRVADTLMVLADRDLETLALDALELLGHDERRNLASRQPRTVEGREALVLDTWDRLSHDLRKRHLFVRNGDDLLVLRMDIGRFEDMEPGFAALASSLTFD